MVNLPLSITTRAKSHKNSIDFPPIYRNFALAFELGMEAVKYEKFYYEPEDEYCFFQFLVYKMGDFEIAISYLDNLEDVEINFNEKNGYSDEDISMNLLKIGSLSEGGGVFVGRNSDSVDKVYINDWNAGGEAFIVSDDIFQFISGLFLVPEDELEYGVNVSQLYKRYEEDFYRVNLSDDAILGSSLA